MELIELYDKFNKILKEAMFESYNLGYADGSEGKQPPEKKAKSFTAPTIPEVKAFYQEYYKDSSDQRSDLFADKFYNHYSSKGWMIGKNKMKDWKAAIRGTWSDFHKQLLKDYPDAVTNVSKPQYANAKYR